MDLECHIISAGQGSNSELYNKVYAHWKSIWMTEIFKNIPFTSNYFLLLNNIAIITCKGKVAAVAAFNYYELSRSSDLDSSYIQNFKECGFLEKCNPKDRLISVEFVSRDPLFSVKNTGISLGSVLIGLILEEFKSSEASYALGTTSIHQGVTRLANEYGYYQVGEMTKYGVPCAIVVNSKETVKEHGNSEYNQIIKTLWRNRHDHTRPTAKIA